MEWNDELAVAGTPDDDLLALDEALHELEQHDAQTAELVKLRYFSGLSHQQAAEALGITRRVADRLWAVAKAWLYQRLQQTSPRPDRRGTIWGFQKKVRKISCITRSTQGEFKSGVLDPGEH